ncbi:M23 family metallopeptidase [Microbacterium sp. 4R-513]|uniref:M23 family metallopeptidase n=1 Tax=Microbacterium sp. 4R-513 TaxID=2567934 RepID=UPI0013E1B36A|nr:M23 family metallopeptidase [Microbacterium sp. 4R-513]QIG40669.1 M23 family metallopeptidase [Microbacterium sp. 4R-513]
MPPSQEPGTDYACAPGTTVRCAADGWVIDRKLTNSGAMGRYITVALDDGRTVRYLHLSSPWARVGDRVAAGQGIAASGASGFGSDQGYGAHVHVTLWPGAAWAATPIDFHAHAGAASASLAAVAVRRPRATQPREEETEMKTIRRPEGTIFFADEIGADHVGSYRTPDIGLGEFLESMSKVFGATEEVSAREFDIAVAIAQRRWAAKRAEIVNEVVAKLTPIVAGAQPVIDPALIRDAILSTLDGLDAGLDPATIDAIANNIANDQHDRMSGMPDRFPTEPLPDRGSRHD